jgi:2-polyprenyl-6-hydroxyphenyl methylase/3-demethylubiquinone-9 3-methyltransferase
MNFFADVRDWLGGYPYESISPQDLRSLLSELGFSLVYSFEGSSRIGIFGSGCDEFLFQKIDVKYP